MSSKNHLLKVGISIGDFNGISSEIIIKTLKDKSITEFFTPVIFGSGKLFSYLKNIFKIQQNFNFIDQVSQAQHGKINIVTLSKDNVNVTFGLPSDESTQMAIDSLEAAVQASINGEIDVLVTAPINKDEMMRLGFKHAGHTGFLEEKWGNKGLMFLVSDELKVAVATHHIPVSEISHHINKDKLKNQITLLNQTLIEDFNIRKPKIAVLGLNPHAGDGGRIGLEEQNIIIPVLEELSENGILAFGPFPADSFFQPEKYRKYDAVLAMYHDQGLAPFKTLAYTQGVNYTAGLPFIRTSPDHGVAYDIAGKNIADESSFREAIFSAIAIYKNRNEYKTLSSNYLEVKNTKYNQKEDR